MGAIWNRCYAVHWKVLWKKIGSQRLSPQHMKNNAVNYKNDCCDVLPKTFTQAIDNIVQINITPDFYLSDLLMFQR